MTGRRVPLVLAAGLLVALAVVAVVRGQAEDRTSPFDTATAPTTFAEVRDARTPKEIGLGRVCAPGGETVTIEAVRLVGVTGAIRATDFGVGGGTTVTAECDVTDPQVLSVDVARASGESGQAEGVEVVYSVGGETRTVRLARPITVCRQLSEC